MINTASMANDMGLITPLIVLWITAFVILLGDVFIWKRDKGINTVITVVGFAGVLLWQIQKRAGGLIQEETAFAGGVNSDFISQVATIALMVTGILATLMSSTYLKNRDLNYGEYYALMLLSASGAVLMAMAGDLIVLFIGLEILSFALYVLAGFARTDVRSDEASLKYFLLGAFASAFLLYGIALILIGV